MLQKTTKSGKLVTLGITQVSPSRYQPRRVFDEDALMELSGIHPASRPAAARDGACGGQGRV